MKSGIAAKIAAIVCAVGLAVAVMSQMLFARDDAVDAAAVPVDDPEATFVVLGDGAPQGTPEVTDNRQSVPLYVDGREAGVCPMVGGEPYVGAAAFCSAVDLPVQAVDTGSSARLTAEGLDLSAQAGERYFTCNDRYLFAKNGVQTLDGALALPVEQLVKCLGVTVSWDREKWRVSVEDARLQPLASGSEFYEPTDVVWLSRLIYAMAAGESLDVQVAVGSVCVNRVGNAAFESPSNIYEVVMAKNQFDVVTNGMIYSSPDEQAELAAKLALEGCDVVDGATYVAAEELGAGYECVARMGQLRFYTAA